MNDQEYFEYSSCTLKKRYPTEKAAKRYLKRKRKAGYIIDRSRVYACEFCKGFHITTKGEVCHNQNTQK